MGLRLARIEDVPVPELSGLALVAGSGSPELLAVGDRKSVLLRAALTDERLEWSSLDLGAEGGQGRQFEGVTVTGDGKVLVLREDPPTVSVVGPSGALADTITFEPGVGKHLHDVFDDATSSGEGLVPLHGGRLLVAQEKRPPLLVEFGPRGAEPAGISAGSLVKVNSPGSAAATADGTFIVGLDTRTPEPNLCWYPR